MASSVDSGKSDDIREPVNDRVVVLAQCPVQQEQKIHHRSQKTTPEASVSSAMGLRLERLSLCSLRRLRVAEGEAEYHRNAQGNLPRS